MVFRVGPPLVIEVVEETHEAPRVLVGPESLRVGSHRSLDAPRVTQEPSLLRELPEHGQRLLP